MSVTLTELATSRGTTEERRDTNLELTTDVIYILQGSDNPLDSSIRAYGPQYGDPYDGVQPLYVISRKWEVLLARGSAGVMKLIVTFGHPSRLVVSENEIEINALTDTLHIEQAIDATHYPSDINSVDKAIGVSEEKIEGVDIFVPKATYSETMELDTFDDSYRDTLIDMVGTVNDDTFKGWAAGEVIFLGATVTKRGSGKFKLKFNFGVSFNKTLSIVTDSGTESVTKFGWDYLWFEKSRKSADSGATVKQSIQVAHTAQVYPVADFSLLGV